MNNLYWDSVTTPHGDVIIMATDRGVCWVGLPGTKLEKGIEYIKKYKEVDNVIKGGTSTYLQTAVKELKDYIAGKKIEKFSGPFELCGSPFQVAIWKAMLDIPYGEVKTYGALAKQVGSPLAARAVGMACNRNPIAILVPCHRVVGSNGSLTGYGGGLPMKKWLLGVEKSQV
jgi:methylated-DNA-[protein]-cysteine S-methyltransferase